MNDNDNEANLSIYDSSEHRGIKHFITRNFRDLITFRYAIYNLISSNLRARYRRSAIGFLWSLLNPLFSMAIMSIVFSTVFQNKIEHYSIYIFSGLLPWNLISSSIVGGSISIVLGEGFLKKIYVPRFVFPLVTVGVEVVNFLLSLFSLFFLAILLGAKLSWGLLMLPFALLLTAFFLLGLVLIISILTVFFRDLTHIIQIAFTGLFYLTPIVYQIALVANNPLLLMVIKLNPFFYFVDLFHIIIYQASIPDTSLWLTCLGLTVLSLILGLTTYNAKEKDVIYRL